MQHFSYKLLYFFLFCGFLLNYGYAQTTYNIATTGTNTITTCGMTIYDDGGPNANYSSSCSSYTIIQPASSGCYVHPIGSYTTENGFDKITIYDGEGAGTTLVNAVSGTGTIDVTSSTGPLTLFFRSDGSTN